METEGSQGTGSDETGASGVDSQGAQTTGTASGPDTTTSGTSGPTATTTASESESSTSRGGVDPLVRTQVWYGASTTEYQSNSTPAYAIPSIVADLYEKTTGSAPNYTMHTCGGCSLSSWLGQMEWNDATSGEYDIVIVTPIRTALPVTPSGATGSLQTAIQQVDASELLTWAPVQPDQDDTGADGYFACAQENAQIEGEQLAVAPVMQAMAAARAAGFAMDNHDISGTGDPHYTRAGAYLVALTIFAEISGFNPIGVEPTHMLAGLCQGSPNAPHCVMTDADALELQQLAWAAVGGVVVADCGGYCGDASGMPPICML